MVRNYFRDLKLTKKLLVSPFTVLLLLMIFGAVSYYSFSTQKSAIDDIYNQRFKRSQAVAGAIMDLEGLHAKVAEMYSSVDEIAQAEKNEKKDSAGADGTAAAPNPAYAAIREDNMPLVPSFRQIAAAVQEAGKSSVVKEEREAFLQAKESAAKYGALLQSAIDKLGNGKTSDTAAEINQAEKAYTAFSMSLYTLLHLEKGLSEAQYLSSGRTHRIALGVMALILLSAVVLSVVVSLIMKALILSPITKTVDAIEAAAGGDLTRRIEVESRDEIGEMAGHFNAFVEKLHETVGRVAESSSEVASAANTLDGAAGQMASGAEEAAVQIDAVAAASEEMSKTSSEIAQNCATAVRSAEAAGGSVNSGEAVIRETIEVMGRISDRVKESAGIIKRLGERSDQIGEIVGLIKDVADQTNLLALNAAIEAARAGDHGRGFAVVADEVRKLAERTGNATREITDTIQAMQAETKNAVSSMEAGVSEVDVGAAEAAKSGEALKDILLQINKVTGEINQIAVASEQETETTNQIASSILQISTVMQSTARRIQEDTTACSRLAGLSKGLQSLVGQFRLREGEDARCLTVDVECETTSPEPEDAG